MSSFNDDLVLGLGLSTSRGAIQETSASKAVAVMTDHRKTWAPASRSNFATTLTLGLSGDHPLDHHRHHNNNNNIYQPLIDGVKKGSCDREAYSSHSGVSNSFSNGGRRGVKRERDVSSEELEVDNHHQGDNQRVTSSRVVGSDEDEDVMNYSTNCARKKLRLTKEQSALLEESFKHHSTLNPKQKQTLAGQLNLRPRQVEVWFQNRRARTKLKQTEVDCEFLKKCCESLTDENRRLQKEVQELKALKISHATSNLYMKMPAATLTMCPSCEKINNNGRLSPNHVVNPKTSLVSMAVSNKPHYYNPFTNPAAC